MRKLFLALGFLLALPTMAMAQSATPADPADAGYHVVAISAGAVAGVIVANALTGGLATPVMTIGAGGGVAVWRAAPPCGASCRRRPVRCRRRFRRLNLSSLGLLGRSAAGLL